jgi:hypothetical protein
MSHHVDVGTIHRYGVIAIVVSAAVAFSANYASGQEDRAQGHEVFGAIKWVQRDWRAEWLNRG